MKGFGTALLILATTMLLAGLLLIGLQSLSNPDSASMWPYALAGSAPFFLTIGTILFAAGKVEEIILAGRETGGAAD